MSERDEAIRFYESQLSRETVEECKAETWNEEDDKRYVGLLIDKYKCSSNDNHNELNKIDEDEK